VTVYGNGKKNRVYDDLVYIAEKSEDHTFNPNLGGSYIFSTGLENIWCFVTGNVAKGRPS
jgi:hypothetical protein